MLSSAVPRLRIDKYNLEETWKAADYTDVHPAWYPCEQKINRDALRFSTPGWGPSQGACKISVHLGWERDSVRSSGYRSRVKGVCLRTRGLEKASPNGSLHAATLEIQVNAQITLDDTIEMKIQILRQI